MQVRTTWKKLLQDSDTVSYSKDMGEYKIIIEARNNERSWEIIKKYVGGGVNFVETYNAHNANELKRLLKHLRSEKDLSREEIANIGRIRKRSLKITLKRGWKTETSEKWFFSLGEEFTNIVFVRYGKEVTVDLILEDQLRYIEEKISGQLHEVLRLDDYDVPLQQNVYYYSKKTSMRFEEPEDLDFHFVID